MSLSHLALSWSTESEVLHQAAGQQVYRWPSCRRMPASGAFSSPPFPCLVTMMFEVKGRYMVLQPEPKSIQILTKDSPFFPLQLKHYLLSQLCICFHSLQLSRRYSLSFVDLFVFVKACMVLDWQWGFTWLPVKEKEMELSFLRQQYKPVFVHLFKTYFACPVG